jgi:hypothetical protein
MLTPIAITDQEIQTTNEYGETIRVVHAGSGPTDVQVYHSDLDDSDNPCTLVTAFGVFMLINAQGEPQVVSLPEMAFLLNAALRLNTAHSG